MSNYAPRYRVSFRRTNNSADPYSQPYPWEDIAHDLTETEADFMLAILNSERGIGHDGLFDVRADEMLPAKPEDEYPITITECDPRRCSTRTCPDDAVVLVTNHNTGEAGWHCLTHLGGRVGGMFADNHEQRGATLVKDVGNSRNFWRDDDGNLQSD